MVDGTVICRKDCLSNFVILSVTRYTRQRKTGRPRFVVHHWQLPTPQQIPWFVFVVSRESLVMSHELGSGPQSSGNGIDDIYLLCNCSKEKDIWSRTCNPQPNPQYLGKRIIVIVYLICSLSLCCQLSFRVFKKDNTVRVTVVTEVLMLLRKNVRMTSQLRRYLDGFRY